MFSTDPTAMVSLTGPPHGQAKAGSDDNDVQGKFRLLTFL